MTDRLLFGRVHGSVADVIDAGLEVLPHFEMAVIPLLDGNEEPAEVPAIRRRLRSEGIRAGRHRGALLLEPGDLERAAAVGLLTGGDELYLVREWNDEFEPFPGRIGGEVADFAEATPLGLEEWILDAGCILALADAHGVNFATYDPEIDRRVRIRFPAPRDRT